MKKRVRNSESLHTHDGPRCVLARMPMQDITDDALVLLRAIKDTKGRFGLTVPIDVVLGRQVSRITKASLDKVPSFGTGSHRTEAHWKTVGRVLCEHLLVVGRSAGGKGKGKGKNAMSVYSVSDRGQQLLQGGQFRVHHDLVSVAEAVDSERAWRAERATKRKSTDARSSPTQKSSQGVVSNSSTLEGSGDVDADGGQSSDWLHKRRKLSPPGHEDTPLPTDTGSAEDDGLRPAPNPGIIHKNIPHALDAALMPFQRAGVAFAIRREGRVLIGDEMGLGKTIQAIAVCSCFRENWPALVVVPNSVRLVWADELERWMPELGPLCVNVVKSGADIANLSGPARFHIVSYGILARACPVRDLLHHNSPFGIVVVDESHMMKNRDAQRTKEVLQITRQASRVVLLSGTPALARPLELYTQVDAVQPGLFQSFSAFTKRYCNPKWTPFGVDLSGSSNLEELHEHLRHIMVRRLKDDVLTDLPPKRRQRIVLDVDSAAVEACGMLKQDLQSLPQDDARQKRRVLMEMFKEL